MTPVEQNYLLLELYKRAKELGFGVSFFTEDDNGIWFPEGELDKDFDISEVDGIAINKPGEE